MPVFKQYNLIDERGRKVDGCEAASMNAAKDHLKYYHEDRSGDFILLEEETGDSVIINFER